MEEKKGEDKDINNLVQIRNSLFDNESGKTHLSLKTKKTVEVNEN